ncbi:MAG: hypothetical protein KAJ19_08475 [Gammaproteobacteria bacterium]|nr:hypothetical protein [Gammaproteobacteria bacterium]
MSELYFPPHRSRALDELVPGRMHRWPDRDDGGHYNDIEWTDGIEPPNITEEQLQNKIAEFDLIDEQNSYIGKRRKAYPDPMIYNDAKVKQASADPDIVANGLDQERQYYIDCLAVKEQIPK